MAADRMLPSRSALSVPASNRRMIEKATSLDADLIILDLEDAVTPDLKVGARANVIWAFTELDWGGRTTAFRCNGLDTPYFYRDLIDIVEGAARGVETIVVPKVQRPEDVAVVDTLLNGLELNLQLPPGEIGLHVQIESARGLLNVESIAQAGNRIRALIFGPGDYSADMRIPMAGIGVMDEWDDLYPGHRMHYPMHRIVVAARAAGIAALDGPMANYKDREGYRRSCLIARSLGFDGKWCIHPDQLAPTNEIFSPTEAEVSRARRVIAAYEEAVAEGRGAITLDGTMIDVASIRLAERVVDAADRSPSGTL